MLRLHAAALEPRTDSAFSAYAPTRADLPQRIAAWSANIVLLATLAADDGLPVLRLFPGDPEAAVELWHRETKIWRAALHGNSWYGLTRAIHVERVWSEGARALVLRDEVLPDAQPPRDLAWTWRITDGLEPASVATLDPETVNLKSNAQVSETQDMLNHSLAPFTDAFPTIAYQMVRTGTRVCSATHLLAEALISPSDAAFEHLAAATEYLWNWGRQGVDLDRFCDAAYRAALAAVLTRALSPQGFEGFRTSLSLTVAKQYPPASAASPHPEPSPAT